MNLEKYAEFQKPQIAVLSGIPFAYYGENFAKVFPFYKMIFNL